mmetsp:Transcript_17599/g.34617  ORF Transcript_17599/g.34617 Transcript_17599/m.34617 type:complete len:208 (-) Transcript_17599:102-725(-)
MDFPMPRSPMSKRTALEGSTSPASMRFMRSMVSVVDSRTMKSLLPKTVKSSSVSSFTPSGSRRARSSSFTAKYRATSSPLISSTVDAFATYELLCFLAAFSFFLAAFLASTSSSSVAFALAPSTSEVLEEDDMRRVHVHCGAGREVLEACEARAETACSLAMAETLGAARPATTLPARRPASSHLGCIIFFEERRATGRRARGPSES